LEAGSIASGLFSPDLPRSALARRGFCSALIRTVVRYWREGA
jgi:hypothetical protein